VVMDVDLVEAHAQEEVVATHGEHALEACCVTSNVDDSDSEDSRQEGSNSLEPETQHDGIEVVPAPGHHLGDRGVGRRAGIEIEGHDDHGDPENATEGAQDPESSSWQDGPPLALVPH